MITAERLSKLHIQHTFQTPTGRVTKPVNLVFKTPDNRWVLSKVSSEQENAKCIMGVRSPSGETTLFLNKPVFISDTLEGLADRLNQILNLNQVNNNQDIVLPPIDFDAYNDVIDKSDDKRITDKTVNNFLKAVGIDLKIGYIKKRRNRNHYECNIRTYENIYRNISLYNVFDIRSFVTSFLGAYCELLINYNVFGNYISSQSDTQISDRLVHSGGELSGDEFLLVLKKLYSDQNVNHARSYEILRRSLIRYRETFMHFDVYEKIYLEKFFSYMQLLNGVCQTKNVSPVMVDFGVVLHVDGRSIQLKSDIRENLSYLVSQMEHFSGSLMLPDSESPVALNQILNHFNSACTTEFVGKQAEVNSWFNSMVERLNQTAA